MELVNDRIETLCSGMLAALAQFDRAIAPYGLYASDELVMPGGHARHQYLELERGIKPYLEQAGCTSIYSGRNHNISFEAPGIGRARLRMHTISKIKVRKYGSRYHVDAHERFDERWRKLDMPGAISTLWKQPAWHDSLVRLGLIVLVGFDKAQRPLQREIEQLQDEIHWEKRSVAHATTTWADIYERGFGIRVALWARYSETGVASR